MRRCNLQLRSQTRSGKGTEEQRPFPVKVQRCEGDSSTLQTRRDPELIVSHLPSYWRSLAKRALLSASIILRCGVLALADLLNLSCSSHS